MEFLSIQTDRQKRADARLSIANEGLSDYIKDLFSSFKSSRMNEDEAKALVHQYFNESSAKTGISRLLNDTVNDEKWREKNLTDRPLQINTCFGVIDGTPTDNFPLLVKCFGEMYGLSANVMLKYKSNTELRGRVFTEMRKAKGEDIVEAYEEVLDKYIGQLEATTPDGLKWLKSGGRNIPAVGAVDKNSWPAGKDGFYNYPIDQAQTILSGPTVKEYESFVKAMLDLADLYDRARLLVNNNGYEDPDELDESAIDDSHIGSQILDFVCYDIDDMDAEKNTTAAEYVMFATRGLVIASLQKLLTR